MKSRTWQECQVLFSAGMEIVWKKGGTWDARLLSTCMEVTARPFDPSTKSVAVIDDVEDLAATLVMLLEVEGYVAEYALTGADGLDLIARMGADAVLLDYALPDMTGAEVARTLRGNSTTRGIKILMCTSTLEEAVRPQFSDYDAFLEKPVAHRRLIRELQGALAP